MKIGATRKARLPTVPQGAETQRRRKKKIGSVGIRQNGKKKGVFSNDHFPNPRREKQKQLERVGGACLVEPGVPKHSNLKKKKRGGGGPPQRPILQRPKRIASTHGKNLAVKDYSKHPFHQEKKKRGGPNGRGGTPIP